MIVGAESNVTGNDFVQIFEFEALYIDCYSDAGLYLNDQTVHIIHQIFSAVSKWYIIIGSLLSTS